MSDEVQETPFGGIVRVVKLINGDELVGLVRDAQLDKIVISFPAKIDCALSRDESGDLIEYFKLTNYASNLQLSEISINRTSVYIPEFLLKIFLKCMIYFFIQCKPIQNQL
jgi:hypothetical protein